MLRIHLRRWWTFIEKLKNTRSLVIQCLELLIGFMLECSIFNYESHLKCIIENFQNVYEFSRNSTNHFNVKIISFTAKIIWSSSPDKKAIFNNAMKSIFFIYNFKNRDSSICHFLYKTTQNESKNSTVNEFRECPSQNSSCGEIYMRLHKNT